MVWGQKAAALGKSSSFVIAAFLLFFGHGAATHADTPHKSENATALGNCIRASGGVTSDMRACLRAEYVRLDRELNTTYTAVMKQLKTERLRKRLVESQRVWIWRRDYDCELQRKESAGNGGTAGDLIYDDCVVLKVRERIQWLKKVPNNPGYLTKV